MVIGIDASRANATQKTGTEWYSWHLIRTLVPMVGNHQVRLYSREQLQPGLQHLGPQVEERVLAWPPGIAWSHLRLSWEIFWHPPDILLITADTVPLIHPSRTFTTIHDIAFEHRPDLYRPQSVQQRLGWLRPLVHLLVRLFTLGRYSASELDYHRWSVRHALRACRRVFTVSEYTKRELVQRLAVSPERVTVTYQGVDDIAVLTPGEATPPKLPPRYFLFVGRLEAKKNMAALLRGYAAYRQSVPQLISLVLVGQPGYGWEQAEVLLNKLQLRTAVTILPWQPPSTLQTIMRHARAFVFLAPVEGFGRPPLESLRLGVPVVAAKSGALPEILESAAYYVHPDDPSDVAAGLQAIDTNEHLRNTIVRSGQSRVATFTWQRTAKLTTDVLLEK